MRIWIDTDVGDNPDDAIALLLARRHEALDLVGVSTVGTGPADAHWRAELARHLLGSDGPPVVAGAPRPDLVGRARAEVLVAIGPLTNVAILERAGALPPRLVVMGGATTPARHGGSTHTVETNFGADSAAAAAVLAARRLTLVPLDVTATMTLDPAQETALCAAAPSLADLVSRWRATGGDRALCLHDPLALLVAANDAPVEIATLRLSVDPDGRVRADEGHEHDVVVGVDAPAARAAVLAALGA